MASRWKWWLIPLTLGLGTAGGVALDRQVLTRSAEARAREALAVAEVEKSRSPEPEPQPRPPEPPLLPEGRNPLDPSSGDGGPGQTPAPPSGMPEEDPPQVKPPVVLRDGLPDLAPPPGYFDLPATTRNDGTDLPIVKRGQFIKVEVLEALPGRPITGDRIVRPDGTIGLGFYGDLPVAGLNRHQIKARLLEHLRKTIRDEVLGLIAEDDGVWVAIPPIESNRVFIDETRELQSGGQAVARLDDVKVGGQRPGFREEIREGRLDVLADKIRRIIEELSDLQGKPGLAEPAKPDEDLTRETRRAEWNRFFLQRVDLLEKVIREALEELGKIRAEATGAGAAEANPPAPKPAGPG